MSSLRVAISGGWLITDAFPLTASGKIRKDVLRDQLAKQP